MAAIVVTEQSFEKEVLQADRPVLVDFWASWCGPCKMLLPVVEELAEELKDAKVCKINVDEEPALAEKFNIMTIPTLLVFKEGKLISSSIGVKPKAEIISMLA